MSKSIDQANDLLKEMTTNNYQWSAERSNPRRAVEVHEVDVITAINAKVDKLFTKLDQFNLKVVQSVHVCELCGAHHAMSECQEGNPFHLHP